MIIAKNIIIDEKEIRMCKKFHNIGNVLLERRSYGLEIWLKSGEVVFLYYDDDIERRSFDYIKIANALE